MCPGQDFVLELFNLTVEILNTEIKNVKQRLNINNR